MKGLTQRQQEIFSFIQTFIQAHSYSPSYREIMTHFGFASIASVHKHINVLKRKGLISAEEKCSRSISLMHQESPTQTIQAGIELPFIGNIAAGDAIEMFPRSQSLTVPSFFVVHPEMTYILRVKGHSLNCEMIVDGDLLLVEASQQAYPGDLVIALINQHETLIKRYYPEGAYVRLLSYGGHEDPMVLRSEDFHIQGVVTNLFRFYR